MRGDSAAWLLIVGNIVRVLLVIEENLRYWVVRVRGMYAMGVYNC